MTRPYLARSAKWWITGAAIILLYGTANAQASRCLPRDVLVETLASKYSESLTGGGLQNAQQLVEVWASKSGSFTVFVTRADGFACIVATGQSWHSHVEPAGVDG